MRWLTLAEIKAQLRIESDNTLEDSSLTLYGAAAENFVLRYLQRTEAELKAMNDLDTTAVPDDIKLATLLLVENSYVHRSPVSPQNLYLVPYSFDALVAGYRKCTYSSADPVEDESESSSSEESSE